MTKELSDPEQQIEETAIGLVQNLSTFSEAVERQNGLFPELKRLPQDVRETFNETVMEAVKHAHEAIKGAVQEKKGVLQTSSVIVRESGEIFKSIGQFYDKMTEKDPTVMKVIKAATYAALAYLTASCSISITAAVSICTGIAKNIGKITENVADGLEMIDDIKNKGPEVLGALQKVYKDHDLESVKELATKLTEVGEKLGDVYKVITEISALDLTPKQLDVILSDKENLGNVKTAFELGAKVLNGDATQDVNLSQLGTKVQEGFANALKSVKDQLEVDKLTQSFDKNITKGLKNFKTSMEEAMKKENPVQKSLAIISASTKLADSIKEFEKDTKTVRGFNTEQVTKILATAVQKEIAGPAKGFIEALKSLPAKIQQQFGLDHRVQQKIQQQAPKQQTKGLQV